MAQTQPEKALRVRKHPTGLRDKKEHTSQLKAVVDKVVMKRKSTRGSDPLFTSEKPTSVMKNISKFVCFFNEIMIFFTTEGSPHKGKRELNLPRKKSRIRLSVPLN